MCWFRFPKQVPEGSGGSGACWRRFRRQLRRVLVCAGLAFGGRFPNPVSRSTWGRFRSVTF